MSEMEKVTETSSSTQATSVDPPQAVEIDFDNLIAVEGTAFFPGHAARKLMLFKLITSQMDKARKSFNFNEFRSNTANFHSGGKRINHGIPSGGKRPVNVVYPRSSLESLESSLEFEALKSGFPSSSKLASDDVTVSEFYASLVDDHQSRKETKELLWRTFDLLLEELGVISRNYEASSTPSSPPSSSSSSLLPPVSSQAPSEPFKPRQKKPWTCSYSAWSPNYNAGGFLTRATSHNNSSLSTATSTEEAEQLNRFPLSPNSEEEADSRAGPLRDPERLRGNVLQFSVKAGNA